MDARQFCWLQFRHNMSMMILLTSRSPGPEIGDADVLGRQKIVSCYLTEHFVDEAIARVASVKVKQFDRFLCEHCIQALCSTASWKNRPASDGEEGRSWGIHFKSRVCDVSHGAFFRLSIHPPRWGKVLTLGSCLTMSNVRDVQKKVRT